MSRAGKDIISSGLMEGNHYLHHNDPGSSWEALWMKRYIRGLPILDVNPDGYTSGHLYPIQPYRMDEGVNIGFPSRPYDNFVAFYHQIRLDENESRKIYPAGNSAVVCCLDNHRTKSILVGTPTFPRKAEYAVSKSEYFVAFFWLGMGYCLFPIPPSEIIDIHIPLDEIFPEASKSLTEEMGLAKSFHRRVYLFERFLSEIIIDLRPIPAQHKLLIKTISRASETSFDDNAKKACHAEFTSRHIRRLCIKYLGISPNLIRRIIRYQKTLHFLNVHPEDQMAGLAAQQGYFDQSHFIKEFKRFQSITPTEFICRLRRQ
jgi:AraC-like DNA-binding protein